MFTSSAKPFQLASYKKSHVSEETKEKLLSSYTCVMSPVVTMAGVLINKKVVLGKKDKLGNLHINGSKTLLEPIRMTLQNLIANFKESEGVDFMVLNLEPYFLITRQPQNKIGVFMTTTPDYVEMFAGPEKVFGKFPENVLTFDSPFRLKTSSKKDKTAKSQEKTEITDEGVFVPIKNDEQLTEDEKKLENGERKLENDEVEPEKELPRKATDEEIEVQRIDSIGEKGRDATMSEKDDAKEKNDAKTQVVAEENYKINVGKPISDEDFQKLLDSDSSIAAIKYGKLENGTINFTRQPLPKPSNYELTDLFKYFSFGEYDFVEICGKTKFAGYRNGQEFVWFAQLPAESTQEHCYIIEVAKAMHPFTIYEEAPAE